MATKRPAPQVHPSRQDQVPNEPCRKRQKPNNAGPKSFKKAHTVNELKNQVRSLKRLLSKNDGMPANVRVEKERALRTAQHELQKEEKAKKRSDMIGKYHKVRFFDRQKAAKRLKRAQKELKACKDDEERIRLAKVVEDAEVDANYPQYYPLDQDYVRLFAKQESDEGLDDEDKSGGDAEWIRSGDEAMWERVKQCMAEGTLDDLRNGRLTGGELEDENEHLGDLTGKRSGKNASAGQTQARKRVTKNPNEVQEDEDESDGGFFE